MSTELLRNVALLKDLPADTLAALAANAELVEVPADTVLIEEGSAPDAMYVVIEGQFEVSKHEGQQVVHLNQCGIGEPLGEMALLAERPRTATVRAERPSRLLKIDAEHFRRLVGPALPILRAVVSRLENQEAQLRQHGKMAALGTLTAGLLHDLNNPAAAVLRGVSRLRETLGEWQQLTAGLTAADAQLFDKLNAAVAGRTEQPVPLDALSRSDLADALESWLDDLGVAEAWQVAPQLAELGWTAAELEALLEEWPPERRSDAIRWAAATGEFQRLLDEARDGAAHVSEIVGDVKNFSRRDEAPITNVDLHDSLESALRLVRHKLSGVKVIRDYDPALPRVEGYAADLNETWVNLVDNAIDAMDGSGELTVRTRGFDDHVTVEIADNGPGIPPDVLERMWEPFFTTKAVGAGTGLGLANVFKTVVERHGGRLAPDSEPGRTQFTVWLPRQLSGSAGGSTRPRVPD
jgi:signal transduction histidine kinase